MHSGNFAEAQLRALIDVAAVAAGAHRLEDVLELAAERALAAVGGASLSISRWDRRVGVLRTLVNVGDLSPHEERFPGDEVYSVEDYPSLMRLMGEESSWSPRSTIPTSTPPSATCSRSSERRRASRSG